MATLSYLTDVIGPRLTGSPNMKRANEWTRDRLAAWGLSNAHLEAWGPFGRGWSLKRFSAQVIEPQCIPLIAYPEGVVAGYRGDPDRRRSSTSTAKTEADFARFKGKIKGAIVLTAPAPRSPPTSSPWRSGRPTPSCSSWPTRRSPPPADSAAGVRASRGQTGRRDSGAAEASLGTTDSQTPRRPSPGDGWATRRPRSGGPRWSSPQEAPVPDRAGRGLARRSELERRWRHVVRPVRQPSPVPRRPPEFGQGRGATSPALSVYDKDAPKTTPQIVMAQEHYNRLVRMIEQGEKPQDGRRPLRPVPRRRPDGL